MFVFGGWNGKKALNDLYILELDELKCTSDPETHGQKPACRNNHTTAVHGEKIYFHGGHDGNQWLDDLHMLNTMSLVWTKPKVSG